MPKERERKLQKEPIRNRINVVRKLEMALSKPQASSLSDDDIAQVIDSPRIIESYQRYCLLFVPSLSLWKPTGYR